MKFSMNIGGRLLAPDRAAVMAIVNATPDSFYAESRAQTADEVAGRARLALSEGADILDLGAYSTRPGHSDVSAAEEADRLLMALEAVRSVDRDVPVSVDTFRADVARQALDAGADIINDISRGAAAMYELVATRRVPYIVMHNAPVRDGSVAADVMIWLQERIARLKAMGALDIIPDPGFGFQKTVEQNWELMAELPLVIETLGLPTLVGISRKSMLFKPLGLTPDDVLPATTTANLVALQAGAAILRVHDVGAARQALMVFELTNRQHNTIQHNIL